MPRCVPAEQGEWVNLRLVIALFPRLAIVFTSSDTIYKYNNKIGFIRYVFKTKLKELPGPR